MKGDRTMESDATARTSPAHDGRGPAGLLLSRDLIFTSKVTGTARELGYRCWSPATWRWPRR